MTEKGSEEGKQLCRWGERMDGDQQVQLLLRLFVFSNRIPACAIIMHLNLHYLEDLP